MAVLIYSGLLLITGLQIKAFNEARDEVLSSWSPPGARAGRGAACVQLFPCNEVALCSGMEPGRKNRLKMMSSSKSFLALSSPHARAAARAPPLGMPRIYLAGPDRCNFYDLIAFLPW